MNQIEIAELRVANLLFDHLESPIGCQSARYWEYAYIRQYQRTHRGFCPRGQWFSCK